MANGSAPRPAHRVAPRPHPAGRAVLLFGICAPQLAGRRLTIEGRRIQAIAFGRLALLLAFVEQAAYAPDEIERKRGDAAWLAAEARVLEGAVARARATGAVLPMRLLTAYADAGALEEAVRENYARWSRALTRLGEKRECVVHLYAGPHPPPGGEPYVVRVAGRASRSGRAPAFKAAPAVLEHAQALWRTCSGIATATRRVTPSSRRGALWTAAFLVGEADVAVLAAALARSAEAGTGLGVMAYLEPPRAPFTFAP